MLKKIAMGKSSFKDLHQVFKMSSNEELERKRARLFPIGKADSETSTVSIFLSSLAAVKEYREELLSYLGIKKILNKNINLHVYTEIAGGNENDRPDGLLVITSGKNNPVIEWAGFIEAKVGNNILTEQQIERYVDFAREIGINDIITISNHLTTSPFNCPVKSKKVKFNLFHWSWTYLKVMATRLIRTDAIEDEDHVYILKELRRYFDTHSNISAFVNMGKEWKDCVNKIHPYSESQNIDKETLNVIISSYVQEEKDISLQLTDSTSHYIQQVTKDCRETEIAKMLQDKKVITTTYMIDENKNRTFKLDVCFKSRTLKCYTQFSINKGKAQAQTTALIRLLDKSGVMDDIKVTAFYIRNRSNGISLTLSDLNKQREQAEFYSILDKSLGDEVKYFEIETFGNLGRNFTSSKNFISSIEDSSKVFLNQVMEYLPN